MKIATKNMSAKTWKKFLIRSQHNIDKAKGKRVDQKGSSHPGKTKEKAEKE